MDLTLIPTTDMIDELAKRYLAMVFTSVDHDENVQVFLNGSALLCSGLLHNAQNEILWASFPGTSQ